MQNTVFVQNRAIRTDWIHRIEHGRENGKRTCTIWFSIGSFGSYEFKGKDAETALQLLANHPGMHQ